MNSTTRITDETNSGPPAVISPSSATTTLGTGEHDATTNSSVWQPARTATRTANLEVNMEEPEYPLLGSPVCHSTPYKKDMPLLPNMMSQDLFPTQRADDMEQLEEEQFEEEELEENGGGDSNDSFNYESDNLLEDLDHLDEISETPQEEVPLSPSSQANLDVLAKKRRKELSSAATDVLRSQNSKILSTRNSFNCAEIAGTRMSQETRQRMQEEQKAFVNSVVEIMRKLRGTQRVKIAIRECLPAPFTVSTFEEQCVETWKDALKSGQVMMSDFFLEGYQSGLPSYQYPRYYITRNVHWLVALKALSKEYEKGAAKRAAEEKELEDEEWEEDEAEEGAEEVPGESGANSEARRKRRNKSKKLLPEQDPYAKVDALIVFDDHQPKPYAPKDVAWFMSLTDNCLDPQSTIIDKAYNCYFVIKLFHLEHEKPGPVKVMLDQHKLRFNHYTIALALLPKAQMSMLYATRATREINCDKFLSSYLKARTVCRQTADDLLKDVCRGQETTKAAIEIFQQHLKQVKYFLLGHEVMPNSAALIQSRVSSQHALPHLKNKLRRHQPLEHSRDVKSILRELASAMTPIVPFKNAEIMHSNSSITQSRLSLVLVSYEDFKDNPGLFEELLQRDDSTWKVFVITKAKLEDVSNLVTKRKKCPGLEPSEVVIGCVPFVAGKQAARKNCVQCVLVSSVNGQCLSAHDLEARLTRIGVTTLVQIQHLRMITYNCESESGTVNPTKKSLLPFLWSTEIECLAIVAAMCCHTIYVSKAFTQKTDQASSAYAQLRTFQAEAYDAFPSPSQLTCPSAKTLAMRERKEAKKRRRGSNDEDVNVEEDEEEEEFAEEPGLEDTSAATSDSGVGDNSILQTKGTLSVSRLVSMAPTFHPGHGQSPADKRKRSQSLTSSVAERGARGVSSASVRTATSTAGGITPVTIDTTRATAIRSRNQRK